jgi:hypothetical protein
MMVQRRAQTPKHDLANFLPDDSNPCFPRSSVRAWWQHKTALAGIMNHELPVASGLIAKTEGQV